MNRLLIANRGEIALRILRAARAEGWTTVAVFSDADAFAPHVEQADSAVRLGPGPAAQSYLDPERVLAAARQSGATAVHPGYGFLAENADFAQQVQDAGLTWVGPSPSAMRALGDKVQARHVAARVGIPVLAGADERDGPIDWQQTATTIGFPVLVKAAAGGGGRGMRVVHTADALDEALTAARREAESSFADGRLLLERFLPTARHIEVQVLGDTHGHVVHLYERECSIQRRRQKVWEEAPAPGLSAGLRDKLGQWATQLARHVGYHSAGTVEFLVHGEDAWFIEMNTRIQVEHPVSEAVTGVDLVRWQLRVALGEALSLSQNDVVLNGHAIEVRVVAEDPNADWRPATGILLAADFPTMDGVRVDTWVRAETEVSPHYDSLLAKVIAVGRDRDHAIRRLSTAVQEAWLPGVANNLAFLRDLCRHPDVQEAKVHTRWLEADSGLPSPPPQDPELAALIGTALSLTDAPDRGAVPAGWRLMGPTWQADQWQVGATAVDVRMQCIERGYRCRVGDAEHLVGVVADGPEARVTINDRVFRVRRTGERVQDDQPFYLHWGDGEAVLTRLPRLPEALGVADAGGSCVAVTPGTVRAVHVAVGDVVEVGAPLVTLESMKVEQTLTASAGGTVSAVRVAVDDAVAQGELLVGLKTPE